VIRHKASARSMGLVFALTVLTRLIYFIVLSPSMPWDREHLPRNGYLQIATHLVNGEGYSTTNLLTYYKVDGIVPTAARSPAPVLVFAGALWLLGTHWYYPLLLLAWCLSGVVAVAAYWIAGRASGREWVALWTGVVFAGHLSEMLVTTTYAIASEPLFAACLSVYMVLFIRSVDRRSVAMAAAAGAMLALAALSRPTVILLPVVSVGWMLLQHRTRGLGMSLAFVLAFVVLLLPWVVRNNRVFGEPIVTTTLGGFVLYRHNGMIEEGTYHPGYTLGEFEQKVRRLTNAAGRPLESFTEPELSALLYGEGRRIIQTYPWRYVTLSALRTVWIWYNENSGRGLYAVQNFLIYLLALGGLVYAWRSREPVYLLLLAHIAYFVAFHSAINVQYRFIGPIMPYMILLAGLPVHAWTVGRAATQRQPAVG
jgi:4-amino-4-deoxy-L-arabinose transferase-like glycosyltransferase